MIRAKSMDHTQCFSRQNQLAPRPRARSNASMKAMIVFGLLLGLVGCGGMEGMHARGMSNAELKSRFAEIEREQTTYHAGESDSATLRRFEKLSREESAVEGELLRRCQAGDKDACLPRFNWARRKDGPAIDL